MQISKINLVLQQKNTFNSNIQTNSNDLNLNNIEKINYNKANFDIIKSYFMPISFKGENSETDTKKYMNRLIKRTRRYYPQVYSCDSFQQHLSKIKKSAKTVENVFAKDVAIQLFAYAIKDSPDIYDNTFFKSNIGATIEYIDTFEKIKYLQSIIKLFKENPNKFSTDPKQSSDLDFPTIITNMQKEEQKMRNTINYERRIKEILTSRDGLYL